MPTSNTQASSLAASKIKKAANDRAARGLDFLERGHQFFGARQAVADLHALAVVAQVR
jgi:hypothetical protein